MTEKFCLKWNDFHSNVSKSFGLLRNENYLQDVTLVGDDYKQISAHKLVLSACSEYFRNIFKNNGKHPFQHPLICLNGISSEDLDNVLNYIYNGEVQIYQDQLDRFLEVAQRLKLEGLLASENQESDQNVDQQQDITNEDINVQQKNEGRVSKSENVAQRVKPEKMVSIPREGTVSLNSVEMNDINEKISEHLTQDDDKQYRCTLCGKRAKQKIQIQYHIETHMDGLQFSCKLCDKIFRSRNVMAHHKSRYHI